MLRLAVYMTRYSRALLICEPFLPFLWVHFFREVNLETKEWELPLAVNQAHVPAVVRGYFSFIWMQFFREVNSETEEWELPLAVFEECAELGLVDRTLLGWTNETLRVMPKPEVGPEAEAEYVVLIPYTEKKRFIKKYTVVSTSVRQPVRLVRFVHAYLAQVSRSQEEEVP